MSDAAEQGKAFLIFGAGGMLGTALQRALTERRTPHVALTENDLDITNEQLVWDEITQFRHTLCRPECFRGVVLNAAAYTNVERAEDEPDRVYAVNEEAAHTLAIASKENDCGFVHVSTDFVFDGLKKGPYAEDDEPNPLSVYGASKLAGEQRVHERYPDALIVRTAWVFGVNGVNFPSKILSAARERGSLSVVTDEVGSPTYTNDLAEGILGLVDAGASGLYHLAGSGSCSRYELALEVLRVAGMSDVPVEPTTSIAFPSKAPRPLNSVLDCTKAAALGVEMPHWISGIGRFVSELGISRDLP